VSDAVLLKYPQLYRECHENVYFNKKLFWGWVAIAVHNSLVIYYFTRQAFGDVPMDDGKIPGYWLFSTGTFTILVVVSNLKLAVELNYWTHVHHISMWVSTLLMFIFLMIYCSFPFGWNTQLVSSVHMYNIIWDLFGSGSYWMVFILVPIACLLPDFTVKYIHRNFFPTKYHIAQALQRSYTFSNDQKVEEVKILSSRHTTNSATSFLTSSDADLLPKINPHFQNTTLGPI